MESKIEVIQDLGRMCATPGCKNPFVSSVVGRKYCDGCTAKGKYVLSVVNPRILKEIL